MSKQSHSAITGGTVSVEDGLKAKEEYAPARKVRVDLNFTVPEGAESGGYLDAAANMANAKVAELLGRQPAKAVPAQVPETTTKPAAEKPKAAAATKAPKPEKTKADLEAEMLADAAGEKPAPSVPVEEDDGLGDILGDPEPAPITDAELSSACVKKAEKMKGVAGWEPMKLRKLIEKFTGAAGKHNREIPAAKRPEFLKELEALK